MSALTSAFGSTEDLGKEDLVLFWLHCSEMPGLSLLCSVVSAEVLSSGEDGGELPGGAFPLPLSTRSRMLCVYVAYLNNVQLCKNVFLFVCISIYF